MKTKIILNEDVMDEKKFPCIMTTEDHKIILYVVGKGKSGNYLAIALRHSCDDYRTEVTGGWCINDFYPLDGVVELEND